MYSFQGIRRVAEDDDDDAVFADVNAQRIVDPRHFGYVCHQLGVHPLDDVFLERGLLSFM
jgi:hypothetical protein